MSIVPNIIYTSNATPIIRMSFFKEIENNILKVIQNYKNTTLPDFRLYYKGITMKAP
jgi:hypothetical protein